MYLKTAGLHLPRDPANVNTLKTMVDPYSFMLYTTFE